MKMMRAVFLWLFLSSVVFAGEDGPVLLGVDVFFEEQIQYEPLVLGKRVGLVTNQTGLDSNFVSTISLFKSRQDLCSLVALFSPEHGINGAVYAGENVKDGKLKKIPIHSLHGDTKRPTKKMLEGIDVLVFDIQEIGCRSYTYINTLFYVMEEAAKLKIPVVVFDRPNPINGLTIDGPMLKESMRSFLGYVNIPYCHGLTIGELALFFNAEYKIGCELKVVPMRGWQRWMSFEDTGLCWIPTSPHIPEADSPFFYASTGIIGELGIVSIGVGYTTPFKLIGAPWINSENLAEKLNLQNFPGVKFIPYTFRPFYGMFKETDCQGVKIIITDKRIYKPVSVQYLILGLLKSLYPKKINELFKSVSSQKQSTFAKVNGNDQMFHILLKEEYCSWKLIDFDRNERADFAHKRKKYLLY